MQENSSTDELSPLVAGVKGSAEDLWRIRGHVERPARKIPVVHDVDVAVVGAGVAGIIAARAAGRHGAKTLIVEAFSSLGGNMGVGMFAGGSLHLALRHPEAFPRGIGGIPAEFNRRVVEHEDRLVGSHYFRDSQTVSYVAAKMMEETGVDILLSSVVSDVIREGDAVRGLFVENKSGTLAIRSKVVVDCTGTADVADRESEGFSVMSDGEPPVPVRQEHTHLVLERRLPGQGVHRRRRTIRHPRAGEHGPPVRRPPPLPLHRGVDPDL